MIHMRSEIAQSLTWVPPKDANDAKMSPKSYLSPAETKALNIESGLLLYWPWVEAICPIVWRSACRMWKSIWINFLSIDTNKSLFPEFCILTLKLPLSLQCSIFPSNPNESPCGLPITNTCLLPAVVGARSSPKAAESLRAGAELNSAPPCLSRWWWWWSLRKIWLLLVWFLCNLHLIKLGDNIPSMEKPSSSSFTPKMIA